MWRHWKRFDCSRLRSEIDPPTIDLLQEQGARYLLSLSAKSIRALKGEEARQRMADLRRVRRSRRSALEVQRHSSLFGEAAKWQLANLAEVLKAMS